jgi:hypothetical protein
VATRSLEDRCSLRSLAARESPAATASTIRRWLLIEHPGPWGRDGLLDARLPEGVGAALRDLEGRAGVRVLLIRKPHRPRAVPDGVLCSSIDTRDAWRGERIVDRIEDVLDLDLRDRTAFVRPEEAPLFVTCTHGRRDPCCAEQGRPLAEAIDATASTIAWESTHVGGDRFAANLVAFPHGLYFGRVEPSEGPEIVAAYADERRIAHLERFRGRASHPRHVQAADRRLREELGTDRIDDVTPLRGRRRGATGEVVFATPRGEVRVRLELVERPAMRLTCHSSREETPTAWRVVTIEAAAG